MAYAALISLKNTIEHLRNSSRILLVPASPEIERLAGLELKDLKESLERLDERSSSNNLNTKRVNALDGRIRKAVSTFEDLLESHVLDQILIAKHRKWRWDSIRHRPVKEDDDDDDAVVSSSTIDFGVSKSKLVGFSDVYNKLKNALLANGRPNNSRIIALVGMAGIGKSALAREVFADPSILSHFDCHAWVTVGRRYQLEKIIRSILDQLDPDSDRIKSSAGKKCLICVAQSFGKVSSDLDRNSNME